MGASSRENSNFSPTESKFALTSPSSGVQQVVRSFLGGAATSSRVLPNASPRGFQWLPKLMHYAKRQKSICKHHQTSLQRLQRAWMSSQTNIVSSYGDQPKNSSCCFRLKEVFCCILESIQFPSIFSLVFITVQM